MKISASFFVFLLPAAFARPAIDVPTASAPMQFRVQRGLISAELAETLYRDILEESAPGPNDDFHESLLGLHGDAGAAIGIDAADGQTHAAVAARFQGIVAEKDPSSESLESGILRLEYLQEEDQNSVDELINAVVENNVMEDGGTIHMYLSTPNAAALDNHTDVTDIFVLHLHGSKEWLICPPKENHLPATVGIEDKRDTCSTYDLEEMNEVECESHILYPGDALYLPRRVIHSARATPAELSAHLTFGLNGDSGLGQCPIADASVFWTNERSLQGTCTEAQGGASCNTLCDLGCNGSCNGSCNTLCNCLCDSSNGRSSCDGCCNGGCNTLCNTNCNSGCRAGCDICPSGTTVSAATPSPTPQPTNRPPPPRRPCRFIRIQEACAGLETENLDGGYAKADNYRSCENDNQVGSVLYSRPWRNETSQGFHVMYIANTAPKITNATLLRWVITDGDTFCSNSAARLAVFDASTQSPDWQTSSVILCKEDLGAGLVQRDLEIECMDEPATAAPTPPVTTPPPPPLPPKTASSSAANVPSAYFAALLGILLTLH